MRKHPSRTKMYEANVKPIANQRKPAPTPQFSSTNRGRKVGLFGITLALTLAVVWSASQASWYQERVFRNQTLDQLLSQKQKQGDSNALYLYYLGRKFVERGYFADADPVLRQAVGLDPDSVAYRDEWTKALLGSGLTTAAFGNLKEFLATHPTLSEAHLLMGKFYVTQRSMNNAVSELEQAATLKPNDAEAYRYLTIAQESLNNLPQATEAARQTVRLSPKNAEDALRLASLLARSPNPEEAKGFFKTALMVNPTLESAHREYALWSLSMARETNDFVIAEAEARQALTSDPNDAYAYLALGRSLSGQKRFSEAVASLEKATLALPNDLTPLLELIRSLKASHQETKPWQLRYNQLETRVSRQRDLISAVTARPGDPKPQLELAHLLAQSGDVAGCVRHFAEAKKVPIDSPAALVPAANTLVEAGFAKDALPLARRAVTVSEASPAAHEALGNALLGCGQPREAATSYDTAAKWWHEKYPVYQAKLADYFRVHALDNLPPAERAYQQSLKMVREEVGPLKVSGEAENLAKQAVKLEPNQPHYLKHLLNVQFQLREKNEAVFTAEHLLSLLPQDAKTHALLAILLAEQAADENDLAKAEIHLGQAFTDPNVAPTYHYGMGLVALQRKHYEVAIRELESAIALDPEPKITYFKLAEAEQKAGQSEGAKRNRAIFEQRRLWDQQEANALRNLADHLDHAALYEQTAKLF